MSLLRSSYAKRKVKIVNNDAIVDGNVLHSIAHDKHMGQLIAYTRVHGIVPQWSQAGHE